MEQIQKLEEYVMRKDYRQALGLPEDKMEQYEMLAQGEYNRNYLFIHPLSKKKLVLRINFGSQLHLEDQIEYEYQALKLLERSGRTPRALYRDGSRQHFPNGIMVMEYLPGHAMEYSTELCYGAECLADIHSVPLEEGHGRCGLIEPENPLRAILEECEEMFRVYAKSPLGEERKKRIIRNMLDTVWKKADSIENSPYKCCINTELNSTNFLINREKGGNYVIDWEKPILGDPAQDLGHFLAPTTTFWKTDVILKKEQSEQFLREYIRKVNGRFDISGIEERTNIYIPITCLRGITWCAMAWIQYQDPEKEIFNESTFRKLTQYLSEEFLYRIDKDYLNI